MTGGVYRECNRGLCNLFDRRIENRSPVFLIVSRLELNYNNIQLSHVSVVEIASAQQYG